MWGSQQHDTTFGLSQGLDNWLQEEDDEPSLPLVLPPPPVTFHPSVVAVVAAATAAIGSNGLPPSQGTSREQIRMATSNGLPPVPSVGSFSTSDSLSVVVPTPPEYGAIAGAADATAARCSRCTGALVEIGRTAVAKRRRWHCDACRRSFVECRGDCGASCRDHLFVHFAKSNRADHP